MSADPAARPIAVSSEDAARGNFYGLLARLFSAPPDGALLGALAAAEEICAQQGDSQFALAWRALRACAAPLDEETVREEFEALYVGVGKAAVSPYAGAYLKGSRADQQLVALRQFLAQNGLARAPDINEPEDHIAALCDVMRHLVAAGHAASDAQRKFFATFLWPSALAFCDATLKAERSGFYRSAARFARSFFELEHALVNMY